ncbi:MAG: hypothetical protein QGI37_13160, partial [Verrucomicrobiota bacterium]|nr:hypothetical protein [Verrucomicrobiota bacterium]
VRPRKTTGRSRRQRPSRQWRSKLFSSQNAPAIYSFAHGLQAYSYARDVNATSTLLLKPKNLAKQQYTRARQP